MPSRSAANCVPNLILPRTQVADRLVGQMTARTIQLTGIAEMADRVRAGNWAPNLAAVLGP